MSTRRPRSRTRSRWPELWIGYALHPDVWGRGLAAEVARELCTVGAELGQTVRADAFADNPASHRVLGKVGLVLVGESEHDGRAIRLFARGTAHREV